MKEYGRVLTWPRMGRKLNLFHGEGAGLKRDVPSDGQAPRVTNPAAAGGNTEWDRVCAGRMQRATGRRSAAKPPLPYRRGGTELGRRGSGCRRTLMRVGAIAACGLHQVRREDADSRPQEGAERSDNRRAQPGGKAVRFAILVSQSILSDRIGEHCDLADLVFGHSAVPTQSSGIA